MNDCVMTEVRDALPDLLHGRLSELDMATMTAHVESCPACRAELAFLRDLQGSAPLAPKMDAARIASALPPYGGRAVMRKLPAQPQKRIVSRFAVLAASLALAVAVGSVALKNVRSSSDSDVSNVSASAATSTGASSSASVTTATPAPSATVEPATKPAVQVAVAPVEKRVASLSFVGGTTDLSEAELETLLAELDGMESIPAAEPQSVTLSVEDIEGGT